LKSLEYLKIFTIFVENNEVMKDNIAGASLNIRERDFSAFMKNGDDFFKIELLRPAKSWYKKAAELNPDSEKALQRITECDQLIAYENKVIAILLLIALAMVSIYLAVS